MKADEVQEHELIRTCERVFKGSIGQAGFGFPFAVDTLVRDLAPEPVSPARRTDPGAGSPEARIHTAESRAVAAVGGAHRFVPRFAGGSNPDGFHVSRTSRRSRQVGAGTSGFEGRRFGTSCGPATLGPQRQSPRCISVRPRKYGQEPLMDVLSGRRLLQSGRRNNGRRADDAWA